MRHIDRRIFIMVFGSLWFWVGCGATPAPTPILGPSASSNVSPSTAPIPTSNTEDKVADAAKKFCEHNIALSNKKPFKLLNKKQINACILAKRPELIKGCTPPAPKEIVLKIIISKEGTVTGAFAVGDNADAKEAICAAEHIKTASFPKFIDKPTIVVEKYPLTLQ